VAALAGVVLGIMAVVVAAFPLEVDHCLAGDCRRADLWLR
jgi:hypothetical protein